MSDNNIKSRINKQLLKKIDEISKSNNLTTVSSLVPKVFNNHMIMVPPKTMVSPKPMVHHTRMISPKIIAPPKIIIPSLPKILKVHKLYIQPQKNLEIINSIIDNNLTESSDKLYESNENNRYVCFRIRNGLGNRIFQVLAALGYAEKYNKIVVLCESLSINGEILHEKDTDIYIKQLFPLIKWVNNYTRYIDYKEKGDPWSYYEIPYFNTNVLLHGHYQNELYFPSSSMIPNIRTAYYKNTYFVHIRAGDYLSLRAWSFDLTEYYKKCFNILGKDVKYIVFSNDNIYAKKYMSNFDIKYTISDKTNQLDTLIEMANCAGGICANSTFSWMGAFFQGDKRGQVFMPGTWKKGYDCSGIYPEWVSIVSSDIEFKMKWITMINSGYINFTRNFLLSMKIHNCIFDLIIYCIDDESMNAFSDFPNVKCIDIRDFLKNNLNSKLSNWLSLDYKKIVYAKLDCIKHALSVYKDNYIGFIDTDIIVLKDPTYTVMNTFRLYPESIFVSQCDEATSECTNIHNCKNLCSGIIVFKNVDTVNILLEYTDREINTYNGNQAYIRDNTIKYNIPHVTISKNIFLNGTYPGVCGNLYINGKRVGFNTEPLIVPESAELIHYNYLYNDKKETHMKKNNMWYVGLTGTSGTTGYTGETGSSGTTGDTYIIL